MDEKETIRTILKSIINNKQYSDEDSLKKVIQKINLLEEKKTTDIPHLKLNCKEIYPILQKYDLIKTLIGPMLHYAVVVNKDIDFNLIWVVPITSDSTLDFTIRIKNSRMFDNSYYCCCLEAIPFNRDIYYCGIIDNKSEFIEAYKAIRNYYRTNFKR